MAGRNSNTASAHMCGDVARRRRSAPFVRVDRDERYAEWIKKGKKCSQSSTAYFYADTPAPPRGRPPRRQEHLATAGSRKDPISPTPEFPRKD